MKLSIQTNCKLHQVWLCKPCCPSKSALSRYHPTPSLCTTTHPTPFHLMEYNKTIPFIIETQWLVTLGASPAGFWWKFGIFLWDFLCFQQQSQHPNCFPSLRWTGRCPQSQHWSRGKEVSSLTFDWVDLALVDCTICQVEISSDPARINPQAHCRRNSLCVMVLEL